MLGNAKTTLILGAIVATIGLLAYASWTISWPSREAERWQTCLGHPLSECRVPEGYDEILLPCASYFECSTNPAGQAYVSAILQTHRGTFINSFAYAVVGLDEKNRIVTVEVKRMFPAL